MDSEKQIDIEERLRQSAAVGADCSPGDPLCGEAADEIERLRKEVFIADRAWRSARREIARLKEELALARNERDSK